jgi:putative spermidine/putrescine transport system permease protein
MVPLRAEADMTMAIPSATTGRVSALFWRKPSLACFAAAWPADVVWHCLSGIVADSVAKLYTFDDFTMSVTTT